MKIRIYFETMAGTHLTDAVRALRDSGSSDTLYDASVRSAPPATIDDAWWTMSRDAARYEQVSYSRRALLFAAFAAEAYANDFLYERWSGQDRDALQRLSTVDKYVLLSQLARRRDPLTRGAEPLQTVKWLFQRRDELVHAAPRGEDLTYHPDNHNPREAARCIVAVADAASRLSKKVDAGSVLASVLAKRQPLLDYGALAADNLASPSDAPSPKNLLQKARRRGPH